MSERGSYRGRGGPNDRGRGGGRGGHHNAQHSTQNTQHERPRKENILDLAKYKDKRITVKFSGGREVQGTLKSHDPLMNLVLDDVNELLHDDEGNTSSRSLGLVLARGPLVVLISPVDGSEEIANPFVQGDEAE